MIYENLFFPADLVGFSLCDVINNELENPGLGVTAKYQAPGIVVSVYIYNKCLDSISDGLRSESVSIEFQEAGLDIYRAHRELDLLIPAEIVRLSGTDFIHGFYAYSDSNVGRVFSHLLLRAMGGEFFKFRISYLDGDSSEMCLKSGMSFVGKLFEFIKNNNF